MRRAPGLEREVGKPSEQPLWLCAACAHVQVHPIPSAEQIASYYRPRTNPTGKRRGVGWAGGATEATPSYLRRLRRVAAGRQGALLDVGYGRGSFLRAAHAMGYRVTGLDPNPSRLFTPDFECELRQELLRPGLFPDGSFDVVAAHHVLEHVDDLPRTLRTMHDLLRPGGYLLVELPHDMGSLVKRLKRVILRRGYTKFTRLQHLRFFTTRSLRAALKRTGFRVELCRSVPSHELLRPPKSLLLAPLAPRERWTGRGHNLEAVARKP
jgi:SAM-dependent methyltransferase